MPSPSEQLGQQAYNDSRLAIVLTGLKEKKEALRAMGIIPRTGEPSEDDWKALAREALNERKLRNKPIHEYGTELSALMNKVDSIGVHFRDIVTENTGNFGFLRGATVGQAFRGLGNYMQKNGFFAGIVALFKTMFGGESQESTELQQEIGRVTAQDVGDGLRQRLTDHATVLGMDESSINLSVREAQNKVLARVNLPALPPGSGETGPSNGTLVQADNNKIKEKIREKVMKEFGLKVENGRIVADSSNTAGAARLGQLKLIRKDGKEFTTEELTTLVDTLTDGMHQAATQSPPPVETDLAYATRIRNALQTSLNAAADKIGFGIVQQENGKDLPPAEIKRQEDNRADLFRMMANDTTLGYLQARPADNGAYVAFSPSATGESKLLKQNITTRVAGMHLGDGTVQMFQSWLGKKPVVREALPGGGASPAGGRSTP